MTSWREEVYHTHQGDLSDEILVIEKHIQNANALAMNNVFYNY